jgi:hypothetical protein
MKKPFFLLSLLAAFLVAGLARPALAQLTLTGTNYTESFENISGGSLPAGWTCRVNATAGALGDVLPFTNGIATWSGATIGLPYDMASVFNINTNTMLPFNGSEDATTQNNATNRAPGMRLSSGVDGKLAWTLQIANTIGFSDFKLSMNLLVLTSNTRSGVWTVDYAVGNAPVAFTPLGTMGDLPGNAFGATNSGVLSIPADANNQGANLWIRLALLSPTGPSGSRDTYGIDNFNLSYTPAAVDTNPPSISAQPQSVTNNAGTTALFSVVAEGAPTLKYQWRKNGGNLAGETFANLTLTEVVSSSAGNYDVVVTNNYGAVTSEVATLTVVADPGLNVSPAGRTNMPGDAISLAVPLAGTVPMNYQWLKNGTPLGGASGVLTNVNSTATLLVSTNAAPTDGGAYGLVISNAVGAITGTVANVIIMTTPSTRLASWNFNSPVNDADPSTGVDTPFLGSGTLTITPLTTSFQYRPGAEVEVADLALPNDNSGYRPQGVNIGFNKESGLQVSVDTTGYEDILVSWNENHNSRASRYMRFQYTTNGTDYIEATGFDFGDRDGAYLLLTQALYGFPGVANNPNFGFRIVAEWESTATGSTNNLYVATATGSSFSAANGVTTYDLVTVWGNPLGTASPIKITNIQVAGGTVAITFTSAVWDSASEFTLEGSSTINGTYTNVGATMSEVSPGVFQATAAVAGSMNYYKIKH